MIRSSLLALVCLLPLACGGHGNSTRSEASHLEVTLLSGQIEAIAERARPGLLGVAVMDVASGESWTLNGDRAFPMQSVFKAPLGAAVLAEVDAGRLSLDEAITLDDGELSPPYSAIADAWPQRTTYTVDELLTAASGSSDNTAADVLMRRIGGPGRVTGWLRTKHLDDLRIDRYERELQPELAGLEPFRPQWKGEEAYVRALRAVPAEQRRAATAAYLADPRDTSTPRAAATFLSQLVRGSLLSPASTRRLLDIMTRSQTAAGRLRAAAKDGVTVAHKSGSARTDLGLTPATNDIALYRLRTGGYLAVAVFLAASPASDEDRDAVIADVGRAALAAAR